MGTWVAQSVECQTLVLAQVTISQFEGSALCQGSVLTVRSQLGILSPLLSFCTSLTHPLSLKINLKKSF